MNAKLRYRLLSTLVALCMVLVLFPAVALAAEGGDVAQIGDTAYDTLKEAIDAAVDGDTIELLSDATLPTTSFPSGKTITIDGNGLAIDANQAYLNVAGNVTFENCTMNMHGVPNGHWMYIYMASNGVLTFRNATVTIDGTDAADNTTAMYFPEPNTSRADVNIENSTVTIQNCRGNGISWGGKPNNGYNKLNITGSTVTIDNCAENTAGGGGIIGTFDITLTGSNLTVKNNNSYGSNGSNYYIDSSVVTYSNNGTHGISATDLVIENGSRITAENNGFYGVRAADAFLVDSTSTLTVTGNSHSNDGAGLKLTNGVTDGLVEEGAVVTITDNYCSGLSNNGTLVFQEGAKLTIMDNVNEQGGANGSHGGGIYNSGSSASLTLPSDTVIYNNHALTDGDDIYNSGTITFGKVGADWVLDDCNQMIDGWYDDSADARWEAHADTEAGETNHIVEFTTFDEETGLATVTGLTNLKAAHGAEGKDKTSYPGLDKVIVTEDGTEVDADTAAAGGTVNFKLTTNVPDDLLNYINLPDVDDPSVVNVLADEPVRGSYQLVIHDQMDDELVLDPESFVVMIGDTELALMDEYTIAYDVSHNEDGTCDFEITLDLVNLYEMGAITEEDIDNATPITVTYTATLAEDATAGEYLNTAWVTYPEGESEKSTVTVKTYGISIFKYDQANNAPLSGATFELYQKDDEGNVIEDSVIELTSGENGYAVIEGLDAGTYYLKETQAPEGYVCSEEELTITVPGDAGEGNYVVSVSFANAQVPHTGGTGTLMYTIGGAAIILLAGALLLISRYSRKKQVG